MADAIFGFLNIDKPADLTSHDVVARIRRVCRQSVGKTKVGHAGTLDPMATGVLVICLGYATRLSEYAMQSTKTYRATVHFGIETDTYDAQGTITAQTDASQLTLTRIKDALPAFIGDIQQLPPMYSAIKRDGKKLYELAREGVEIEREARPVTIHHIEVIDWQAPQLTIDVTCGAGTYIRSLAYDLGQALGVGAHLSALIRSRSGAFSVADARNLSQLMDDPDWQQHIIAPQDALTDWQRLQLTAEQAEDVQLGRFIAKSDTLTDDYVMAYMPDGHLLAVLENQGNRWKPHKVFLP